MFVLLNSKETGVTFNNDITESDSLNILEDEFIYNGGGVGVDPYLHRRQVTVKSDCYNSGDGDSVSGRRPLDS